MVGIIHDLSLGSPISSARLSELLIPTFHIPTLLSTPPHLPSPHPLPLPCIARLPLVRMTSAVKTGSPQHHAIHLVAPGSNGATRPASSVNSPPLKRYKKRPYAHACNVCPPSIPSCNRRAPNHRHAKLAKSSVKGQTRRHAKAAERPTSSANCLIDSPDANRVIPSSAHSRNHKHQTRQRTHSVYQRMRYQRDLNVAYAVSSVR